jgi:hypothetical protein
MNDNMSEEFWVHHVVKDFDHIVSSGKYRGMFYEMLSQETKDILFKIATSHIYDRTVNGSGY